MARRLPPLNALRAFEAAGRHLSFTRAAEELRVTQAAVSHQIKALERHLGVRLFHRRQRTLALSEAGHALLPELGKGFDHFEVGLAQVLANGGGGSILTVSVLPTFASGWLVTRLSNLGSGTLFRRWLFAVVAVDLASLAIDFVDVGRYLAGDRQPAPGTAPRSIP